MRSERSWFNPTLFRKNLTRFWPVWGLYLTIWLFVLPITLVLDNYTADRFACRYVLESVQEIGLPMAVVFALLAAVAVWSYLCNHRSVYMMHTLAIRREGLFLTNFLSGMAFMVGPNIIVFVLTLLAELLSGAVDVGALLVWLVSVSLMELFFFCFATFCAMFTGHILGLPGFYAILNGLAAGLVVLIDFTLSSFVFGYSGVDGLYRVAEWLTPAWKMGDRLEVRREMVNGEYLDSTAWLAGTGYIFVYAALGLILAGLALALYRHRHMERVGDVVTVTWMRPVFQYGVAFCSALAFGTLLYEIFRGTLPDGAWTLLVFMLLCGAVGYFVARMLLEKSFRVFGYWKGCVPFLAVLVLLTAAVEMDVTGYERYVPQESEVAKIQISSLYTRPHDEAEYLGMADVTDPEIIRAVLDLHQTTVANRDFLENEANTGGWNFGEETVAGYYIQNRMYSGFSVTYTLTDGKTVAREYNNALLIDAADLEDPASLTYKMDALVNLPQVVEKAYGLSDEKAEDVIGMSLSNYFVDEGNYLGVRDVEVSKDAYEKVLNALAADFAEGNIGRRYLLDTAERMENCFVNDLEIVFYRERETLGQKVQPYEYYYTSYVAPASIESPRGVVTERITVTLQTSSRHTLAALNELGVLEEPVNLLTQAQNAQAEGKWETSGMDWNNIDLREFAWDILGE